MACCHGWTGLRGAEFFQGAVQNADSIVEVHSVHGQPLVEILAWRKPDSLSDVSLAQRRLYVALQSQALQDRGSEAVPAIIGKQLGKTYCKEDIGSYLTSHAGTLEAFCS